MESPGLGAGDRRLVGPGRHWGDAGSAQTVPDRCNEFNAYDFKTYFFMVAFAVGNADRGEVDRPRFPKPDPTPAEADAAERLKAALLDERHAIGQRIRAWRHFKQMNQDDFADLVGVHRAQLGQLESGRVDVRLSSLQRVARALQIPLHELLNPDAALPAAKPPATSTRRSRGQGR